MKGLEFEYKFRVENITDKSYIEFEYYSYPQIIRSLYEEDIEEGIKDVLNSIDMAFEKIVLTLPVIIQVRSKQGKDYYDFKLDLKKKRNLAKSYISINNVIVHTFSDYEEGLALLYDVRDALKQTFLSFWQ